MKQTYNRYKDFMAENRLEELDVAATKVDTRESLNQFVEHLRTCNVYGNKYSGNHNKMKRG
jgi:hypothetical protein